ncbi:MAG: hypothetical protein KGL43_14825, partial [Burkholderiales bacterium]|nr:hypothetical protein [Burkholderiales bacterium]
MKITDVAIRACFRPAQALSEQALRGSAFRGFDFLVVTLRTDAGLAASMFGFAGRSARGAAHQAADVLRPFFL